MGKKGFLLRKKGLFAGVERVPYESVAQLEQLDRSKSLGSMVGRSVVGGLLLGPLGAIAGGATGGKNVSFICTLDDGHHFAASTDLKTFMKIRMALPNAS